MSEVEKSTGTFKSFDGQPVYYETRGQGKPVVMAYGIACGMNHWRQQTRYFSEKYQTILFDYRGHHKTPPPENNQLLSVETLAKDIFFLLQHLRIKQASFWSHSFGSQVLLKTYSLYPEIFANIVFINGFATDPIKKMFGTNFAANTFKFFQLGYNKFPSLFSSLWTAAVNAKITQHLTALTGGFNFHLTSVKDIEVYSRGVGSMDLSIFLNLFEKMMAYDGRDVLEKIKTPTLIIGGTKDSVTPQFHQEELNKSIAGSELVMIPFGTHCTHLDMPEYVNLKIENFLKANHYLS